MPGQGLIGHTGFVGSTLSRANSFDQSFNSKNFRDLAGQSFDVLVCAGVSAVKWVANAEPETDAEKIVELTDVLEKVVAREFVLISTIDVYPDPARGGDEDTKIDGHVGQPYGHHRLALEEWSRRHFPRTKIVRLPALFGPGLKKNALFDLLNDNQTHKINPAGVFQWYPLTRLWRDIEIVRASNDAVFNLLSEPIAMSEIIDAFFPRAAVGPFMLPAPEYRLTSKHAGLFGGAKGYVLNRKRCLEEIDRFVRAYRGVK